MKQKLIITCVCIILSFSAQAQRMSISGNVQDTISKMPLTNSLATVIRIKDSVLVAFTRTNQKGVFEFKNLRIDTLQITISHSRFGKQTFYVFGSVTNNAFDFGKIILPPKSQQLKEVVIYAFKDPVYFKGDTLIYTADSFKVRPNATIEDLLKKLPGIKVDAQGKITSQGKAIDQVLVDGDEFFGADPTIATRNLAANTVESVQVYEKKNENASDGKAETVNVMNLKLKEDSKKGYFGKASAASDFQNFYEGELLANKFTSKQKISVFALGSNTPRAAIDRMDAYSYGLDNENKMQYDDETQSWSSNEQTLTGIPRNFKTGIYYSDKISSKTKLDFNYTYNNNDLKAKTQTRSQYFLTDTAFTSGNSNESDQQSEAHVLNFKVVQTLDSLTELTIRPKLKLNSKKTTRTERSDFIAGSNELMRRNDIENLSDANEHSASSSAEITRKFKTKDRRIAAYYKYSITDNTSEGTLKSYNTNFNNINFVVDSINQKKKNESVTQSHYARLVYTEPLTKKMNIEFAYYFNYSAGFQNRHTFNFAQGEYNLKDSLYSNDFRNTHFSNMFGTQIIYQAQKQRIIIGSQASHITQDNANLVTQETIKQSVNTILPSFFYQYKFSDAKEFRFFYNTISNLPSINQLQPIRDNYNPNQLFLGNPNLLPSYVNSFSVSFLSFGFATQKFFRLQMNASTIHNDFSNAVTYDSIGRTISKPINVNGNYYGKLYVGMDRPFISKSVMISPEIHLGTNKYSSYINDKINKTITNNAGGTLAFELALDTLDCSIGYTFNYFSPISTLNAASDKPYTQQKITAALNLKLPWKFSIQTNAEYTINSERSKGYNINYVLWNASLSKTFFRKENFIVSLEGTDLLDQNISTNRIIQDNVITDTKTNIISRYILLKVVYKFNSAKAKANE